MSSFSTRFEAWLNASIRARADVTLRGGGGSDMMRFEPDSLLGSAKPHSCALSSVTALLVGAAEFGELERSGADDWSSPCRQWRS